MQSWPGVFSFDTILSVAQTEPMGTFATSPSSSSKFFFHVAYSFGFSVTFSWLLHNFFFPCHPVVVVFAHSTPNCW